MNFCVPISDQIVNPMAVAHSSADCSGLPTGHLIAGFVRASDAELARLALADRGHEVVTVLRLPGHQAAPEIAQTGRDRNAPLGADDCSWLVIPIKADDVDIVAEYLKACGAEHFYCKFCSNDAIGSACAALLPRMRGRRELLDEQAGVAAPAIAEFHPLSWRQWTNGLAGASDD